MPNMPFSQSPPPSSVLCTLCCPYSKILYTCITHILPPSLYPSIHPHLPSSTHQSTSYNPSPPHLPPSPIPSPCTSSKDQLPRFPTLLCALYIPRVYIHTFFIHTFSLHPPTIAPYLHTHPPHHTTPHAPIHRHWNHHHMTRAVRAVGTLVGSWKAAVESECVCARFQAFFHYVCVVCVARDEGSRWQWRG